jgi:molecular chaperone DnaJ
MKDYYGILGLQPSASTDEIKKAYRRLALQYHPDKTPGDPYAAEQFAAIKEAYETLTNTSKKSVYLQQRWYHQASGKKRYQPVMTPVTILQQTLELDKYVAGLDVHRMDKQGLFDHINELLDDAAIEKLKSFNDPVINQQVVHHILKSIKVLSFFQAKKIIDKMDIPLTDRSEVENFLLVQKRSEVWDKYRIWIVLLIVLLLCLLIFFIS